MKNHFTLIYFVAFSLLFTSCVPEEGKEVVPPEYENLQKPESNSMILSENTFGNDINNSLLIFAEKSNSNNFYTVGSINSSQSSTNISVGGAEIIDYYDAALVKFDNSGNKLWETQPGFSIYRHLVIPKGVLNNLEYVLVTGYDENENNPSDPDRNRIMLFDENGVFKSNLSYDFNLRLNSLIIVENNSNYIKIVVVGSVFKAAEYNFYPAYCEFKIRKATFEIYDFTPTQIIDPDWENVLFENIEYSNGKYIVSGYVNDGNPNKEKYLGVHLSVHNSTNFKYSVWRKLIRNYNTGKEIFHYRRCMHIFDNKIYLSGYYEDLNKTKTSSGTHWSSPFLNCYDLENGNTVFNKVYPKSETTDKFYDIGDYNGNIYVSGITSQSYCSSCSKEFTIGNAWLCKINPQTGDLLSQRTFGSSTYSTWISQFCFTQNNFWGIGYKRFTNQSGLGWLIRLNPDSI